MAILLHDFINLGLGTNLGSISSQEISQTSLSLLSLTTISFDGYLELSEGNQFPVDCIVLNVWQYRNLMLSSHYRIVSIDFPPADSFWRSLTRAADQRQIGVHSAFALCVNC